MIIIGEGVVSLTRGTSINSERFIDFENGKNCEHIYYLLKILL